MRVVINMAPTASVEPSVERLRLMARQMSRLPILSTRRVFQSTEKVRGGGSR